MTARRGRRPQDGLRVELTVEDLAVPAGVGDEDAVREAVELALREAIEARVARDLPAGTGRAQEHAEVQLRLREPIAASPSGLGRQVAAEVTRVVLP